MVLRLIFNLKTHSEENINALQSSLTLSYLLDSIYNTEPLKIQNKLNKKKLLNNSSSRKYHKTKSSNKLRNNPKKNRKVWHQLMNKKKKKKRDLIENPSIVILIHIKKKCLKLGNSKNFH